MKKRWFKDDLSPYDEPKLDVPADGQPLRIGVSATREPFQFVDKDGRVTGHDGEMARRIAIALQAAGRVLEHEVHGAHPGLAVRQDRHDRSRHDRHQRAQPVRRLLAARTSTTPRS